MPWRDQDEGLLQRLCDEDAFERLFAFMIQGSPAVPAAPRAAGLVAELRRRPGGVSVVDGGDTATLARFVNALVLRECAPQLLHHLALFHGSAAVALEERAPDLAATAWVRSLAAWLALGEQRTYLVELTAAVVSGRDARTAAATLAPEQIPLELVADIAERASNAARGLAPPGRAALLALARTEEAGRLAGAPADTVKSTRKEAERRRTAAIETALGPVREALDDASIRGELATAGPGLLARTLDVWTWSTRDAAVETFTVERIETIGWELYRARSWDALRALLAPFHTLIESLATRIERDPAHLAYASVCAQMFVFWAEVETAPRKIELAERAVKVCPTHRNGRLVLSSFLGDQVLAMMRTMVVSARTEDVERAASVIARIEKLYPQARVLPEVQAMLERVKKSVRL